MSHVATIIASPARADLTDDAVSAVAAALRDAGAETGVADWLDPGIACDLPLETGAAPVGALRAAAAAVAAAGGFDAVVQPAATRRKRLLIADMDATIVTGETLDELADHAGLKDYVAAITQRAMRGELDFRAALRERVGLLKGLPVAALEDTLARIALTPGAATLVATMRAHGAYAVLVSGGFEFFVSRIAAQCGFDAHLANRLEIADGVLTGGVAEPILDKDAKLAALERAAAAQGIALEATMAVGDGANDLPMIQAAGLGVAFHAKPLVRAEAPAVVTHGDLTALLYMQGYRRAELSPV
jgi:phosphoserine phosphatase